MKQYINIFVDKSSGYLNSLVEIISKLSKKNKYQLFFYDIIITIMEELTKKGKEAIRSNKKFCKYHSLIYFEQAKSYYDKYLTDIDENKLNPKLMKSRKEQKEICIDYLRDINSGAVVLFNESFNGGFLVSEDIIGNYTGFTGNIKALSLGNIQNKLERCKLVLSNYEKVLSSIQTENKISKKEAICIANIIKLHSILGTLGSKCNYLLPLAQRVELIVDHEKIDKNEKWYIEFVKLNEKLKKKQRPEDDYRIILSKMKETHRKEFDEIDNKFNKKEKKEFIEFILEKYPYPDYQKDKDNGRDFKKENAELYKFLFEKYQPETPAKQNEETMFKFCIANEISKKLSNLLTNFN
jgi:hypothetical protein